MSPSLTSIIVCLNEARSKISMHRYTFCRHLLGFVLFFTIAGCKDSEEHLFSAVDSTETSIDFENTLKWSEELNIVQYLYAYNGGGVSIGDINNDGLPDIYFTANQLPNKLYLNLGGLEFKDITETSGTAGLTGRNSWTNGVTMVDVNADGFLDIYVSVVGKYKQFQGHNQLFINKGDLTFTESSKEYNLDIVGFSQQAYFFDYDLDGDLDMYQLRHAIHKSEVYQKGTARTKRDGLTGDLLFRNENNKFIDVSDSAGIYGGSAGYGLAAGISDIDNNGFPDIYVSNDFHENDFLYYNNGDGTFTENGANSFGHTSRFSMGNAISDINNDGLADILSLDMKPYSEEIRKKSVGEASFELYEYKLNYGYHDQYPRNMLQLNRGRIFNNGVQFSEIGQQMGVDATDWSWGVLIADFDNDRWKDLFITNGIPHRPNDLDYVNYAYNKLAKNRTDLELVAQMPDGAASNFMYKNDGELGFRDVSKEWGVDMVGYSMGMAYGDLDNDGDLDLVVNNLNNKATVFKNNTRETTNENYLRVKINGPKGNPFGIGAKVIVNTTDCEQTLEAFPTKGWLSSVESILHFGVGNADRITSVQVIWPVGKSQTLKKVAPNTILQVNWKDANDQWVHEIKGDTTFKELDSLGIAFVHHENEYNDFQSERLMPHKLSMEGPRLAVGDINADGLSDFYIGGAKGQPGALYIQTGRDKKYFHEISEKEFLKDKMFEDVDAKFFDADNDGDVDLYVVSGGGVPTDKHLLSDRLYRNDGWGNFTKDKTLQPVTTNGSVVEAADFNNDGHTDLFIGARSVIGSYGLTPRSTILWNRGDGTFYSDDRSDAVLEVGMVTDAVFIENSKELFLVGEWMPISILRFNEKNITLRSLPNTSGWWNRIHADDMDGDGDIDLLVGNYGTNSQIKPTVAKPIGLYVKDFDQNSNTDPLMTYWSDNKEWIFVGLNELKSQLTSSRKQFKSYASFAQSELNEVITPAMQTNAVHKQVETFESVYIENLGIGNFKITPFPKEAQWAPIFGFATADFDGDHIKDILSVGNFYGYQPNIGRADASHGNFLKGNGEGSFTAVEPRNSGWAIPGECRDIKVIRNGNSTEPFILISRNDATPKVYRATQ